MGEYQVLAVKYCVIKSFLNYINENIIFLFVLNSQLCFMKALKKKDYKDAGSGQLYTFLQILSYFGQCNKRTEGWHDRNDYITVLSFYITLVSFYKHI